MHLEYERSHVSGPTEDRGAEQRARLGVGGRRWRSRWRRSPPRRSRPRRFGARGDSRAPRQGAGVRQDVVYKANDPDGAFKSLPANVQARYGPYPYEIKKSPWEAFKGVKKPWKLGFVSFPVGSQYQINALKQFKIEFAKAKKAGPRHGLVRRRTSSRATPRRRPSSRSPPSSRWCVTASTGSSCSRSQARRSRRRSTPPARPACRSSSSTTSSTTPTTRSTRGRRTTRGAAAGVAGPRQEGQRALRARPRGQPGRAGVPGRGRRRPQGVPGPQDRRDGLRQVDEPDGQERGRSSGSPRTRNARSTA